MITFNKAKTLAAGLATALVALASGTGLASAEDAYRPLTVNQHRHAMQDGTYVPAPSYDPYHGPGVLVTAPVHFAGTLAVLPFRAVNAVFPARGNTPLVLIGGPVDAARRLVELPFRIVEAPFGGPNPFSY